MTGGVAGYAALNARVRIMYSRLLVPAEFLMLVEAPDLLALVEALRHTAYASSLDSLRERDLSPRNVAQAIKSSLAAEYQSLIQAAPDPGRRVIVQMYRHYEVDNLKAVLRGIAIGGPREAGEPAWARIRDLLFPTGARATLPAERMTESGSIPAAIELLRGTVYYESLTFALKRYTAEHSLFPLEVALDLQYWRRLWSAARNLSGQDQAQAMRVIGTLVDINNLMWSIRYRVYQHLSEEELINYTLPFGYRTRDEDIRAIAAGADLAAVLRRIYPGSQRLAALLEDREKGLPALEQELRRLLMKECLGAFVGSPFHIGVALAYLVLHEIEVQDLVVIVEAKASGLSKDVFRRYLLRGAAAVEA